MAGGKGGRPEWSTGVGRRWAVVGLVAFAVLDVALVGSAMASVRPVPQGSGAVASVSHTSDPPRPTATTTPTPQPIVNAVAPTRVLAALDGTVAWRATIGGPCPATRATLAHTSDGGATWTSSDAAGPTGSSSVLRITVDSTTVASAIVLDGQKCVPQYIGTYVSGDNWATYPDRLGSSWYLEPASSASVHTPRGDVTGPCGAKVGLAVRDAATAAVLCADHTVYRTTNSGASWGTPVSVPGAVALTNTTNGYATAATNVAGCAGVAVANLGAATGGATTAGCYATATPQPGAVAVASGGSTLWLWAGNAMVRSTNGGATWH